MILKILSFLLFIHLSTQQKIGCIAYKNNYIKIQNVTESPKNELIEIEGFNKYLSGWFGVAFSENSTINENSILIFLKYPNTLYQLENHSLTPKNQSQLISSEIYSQFQYTLANKKGFKTYINVTNLKNMKYIIFASGEVSFTNHFSKAISYDILAHSQDFSSSNSKK